jgi:hypothetical protein
VFSVSIVLFNWSRHEAEDCEEDINDQRETGFRMIEQKLTAFKEELINPKATSKSEVSEYDTLKFVIFGHAAFLTRELELGEFAALDHAGNSIRMVSDRIKSAQYLHGVTVSSPSSNGEHIIPGGSWDLKHILEKAVKDLNMDDWGVEYADIKLLPGHQLRKDEV